MVYFLKLRKVESHVAIGMQRFSTNSFYNMRTAIAGITESMLSFILHSGFQPVGISIHVQHVAAEGPPANQGCYHCGVLKQIRPIGEWQICGHNGAALFASV